MIVVNLNNNRGRKIICAIFILVGAVSPFAWYLVNGGQQEWLVTLLAKKERNNTQETRTARVEEELLKHAKFQRYGVYTHLKTSLSKMKNSTKSRTILEKSQLEPLPRKILIISRGRSGSSFLGDLFNENKKVFYLFEPLAWSVKGNFKGKGHLKGNEDKAFKILDDLYNCEFTEKVYLDFLSKKSIFRKKSNKLLSFPGQCSRISFNSKRCLGKILKSSCLDASSVVVKVLTHRLPQGGLWGIRNILDANKNLKIVHLIRDPRRVIASMKHAGWFKGKEFIGQVARVCGTILENIKHVQNESIYYENRYKVVVFSDMILKPFSTVVELYDFLKMGQVPEQVFSWIKQNTMGSVKGKSMGTYKTFRNSTEVLNRKVDFTKSEDLVIDRYCRDVVKFIETVKKST